MGRGQRDSGTATAPPPRPAREPQRTGVAAADAVDPRAVLGARRSDSTPPWAKHHQERGPAHYYSIDPNQLRAIAAWMRDRSHTVVAVCKTDDPTCFIFEAHGSDPYWIGDQAQIEEYVEVAASGWGTTRNPDVPPLQMRREQLVKVAAEIESRGAYYAEIEPVDDGPLRFVMDDESNISERFEIDSDSRVTASF
jgi:hypothetical protein